MDQFSDLIIRATSTKNCTLDTCDVRLSVYGYRPNLAATLFFLITFALSGGIHLGQGFVHKTWFFAIAMVVGCIGEALGYVSKMLLYGNPFSGIGFKLSLVMLTLAPAFYTAGIYYTLKHITLTFGANHSRLRPALYTWVFVSCDLLSIILQAIGGAIAATADDDLSTLDKGDHIMLAGLIFQVVTLVIFGLLAAAYAFAIYRHRNHLNPATATLRSTLDFRLFLAALSIAYLAILIRCGYRVAELVGGWSRDNQILRNEPLFLGLDSAMCLLATLLLNIWHPGRCFPKIEQNHSDSKEMDYEANVSVIRLDSKA